MDPTAPPARAADDALTDLLDDLFTYHKPDAIQVAKYDRINAAAKAFARVVFQDCPSSPDRSEAIRLIRTARQTANSSIATKTGGLLPR